LEGWSCQSCDKSINLFIII